MKKQLNTPNLSSKKGPEESIRTIQKQPNPPTNISESTPKEDFKEKSLEIFPLLTNRNAQHSSKDNENLSEFRTEIEKKYKKSVMNKIYSFPKTRDCFSENSSMDSLKSVEVYDLSCQNFERKNCFEMKSSSPFRDNSNPQEKNPFLFDKELEKLNKEIEYYKNHRLRTLSREKDNERENHFRPNGISQRKTEGLMSKERPNYIKLLNLLEENNDLDLKKSENKHRTPSNSQSCLRKRDISSKKTPNRIKTEKTPCPFDKKIAKTFENCCEIKENLELNIESSNYRSISRGRQLEESRSKSKTKQNLLDKRILSPISYTYMNNYLYDKEFKQESIKKIYSNPLLKQKEGSKSKERKNNFQEEENDKKKKSKPIKKLYLIQEKENINKKKTHTKRELDKPAIQKLKNSRK